MGAAGGAGFVVENAIGAPILALGNVRRGGRGSKYSYAAVDPNASS